MTIVYTRLSIDKNCLLYEFPNIKRRSYNKREQALFIFNALKKDDRFPPGSEYVESKLLVHWRESRLNISALFSLDLDIGEIDVTIDERCDNYNVG